MRVNYRNIDGALCNLLGRYYVVPSFIKEYDLKHEQIALKGHLKYTKTSYTRKQFKLLNELVDSNDKSNLLIALQIIKTIPRKKKK